MEIIGENLPSNGPVITGGAVRPRKPYCKPVLTGLGDLRSLTLGGSPGSGDSGSEKTQYSPSFRGPSVDYYNHYLDQNLLPPGQTGSGSGSTSSYGQ